MAAATVAAAPLGPMSAPTVRVSGANAVTALEGAGACGAGAWPGATGAGPVGAAE